MLLIDNISSLLTFAQAGSIGAIDDDPVVLIDGERIFFAGPRSRMPSVQIDQTIDAHHKVVMPGFVDAHAHLIFAGTRADEFARRMNNETYEEIMAKGGGIMSTVAKTRAATDDELLEIARARADKILVSGTTTLECKSGYGLSTHDELRLLRLAKQLDGEHALDLHSTFLGAHVVPPEFKTKRGDYVSLLINEMLPIIAAEKLAIDADVFCENGAFSLDESRTILKRAHDLGLGLRAHVQQLSESGGINLIKDLPIKSFSHADFLSDDDIALVHKHDVVIEALPIAALFLRSKKIAPIASLIDGQVRVSIATDFNPGSAMCHDVIVAARLGVTYFGFSIDHALQAITSNAAYALRRDDVGIIAKDALADIVITNCQTRAEILYDWTKHPVDKVLKRGRAIKM